MIFGKAKINYISHELSFFLILLINILFRLNTASWRTMNWFTLERSLSSVLTVITGIWMWHLWPSKNHKNVLRCIQRSNLRIHMRGVHKKELPRLVLRWILATFVEPYWGMFELLLLTWYSSVLNLYIWSISGWLSGKSAMQVSCS